jgi:hypothetical protein
MSKDHEPRRARADERIPSSCAIRTLASGIRGQRPAQGQTHHPHIPIYILPFDYLTHHFTPLTLILTDFHSTMANLLESLLNMEMGIGSARSLLSLAKHARYETIIAAAFRMVLIGALVTALRKSYSKVSNWLDDCES